MGSSHFIHLRLEGLSGRDPPISIAIRFQSESLHVLTRHNHVDAGLRATCPAHAHLYRLWA